MIFNYNLRNYNFRIVLYMLFLSVAGILVLKSASGGDSSVVGKQIMGVALSFTACIIISFIDYHRIFRFNILIYVGCVLLLIAVLITGHDSHGATRWLNIFGFTVQPSEFLKVGLIVVLSWYTAKNQERINKVSVLDGGAPYGISHRTRSGSAKPVHQHCYYDTAYFYYLCCRAEL